MVIEAPYPQSLDSIIIPCQDLPSGTVALLNFPHPFPEEKTDQDFALMPNNRVIRLSPADYREPEHKKYPEAIPLIWEDWLYGPPADAPATLAIGEAIVIAATGLKGNGKSETLAYLSAKALALGMPVWSNMAVKFWLARNDGSLQLCQTRELNWDAVLQLNKELEKGALVIDELSYFASSRLSNSVQNRIINAAVNQVRKRTLDFYTSVKFLRQIDVNIREELDAHFECEDLARRRHGQNEDWPKGCFIKWAIRDISGWSGHRDAKLEEQGVDTLGKPIYANRGTKKIAALRFTWPLYSSYEVVDTAAAFRKVRLDLEEVVVTNKLQPNEIRDVLAEVVNDFESSGDTHISCDDFRSATERAGLKLNEKQLGKELKDNFGITRKRFARGSYYMWGDE